MIYKGENKDLVLDTGYDLTQKGASVWVWVEWPNGYTRRFPGEVVEGETTKVKKTVSFSEIGNFRVQAEVRHEGNVFLGKIATLRVYKPLS